MKKLLIVNPGSTSTKVAVYYGSERKFSETISHPAQELQPFANVLDQADYRAGVIARCLEQAVLSGQVDAIVLTGVVIYSQAFRQLPPYPLCRTSQDSRGLSMWFYGTYHSQPYGPIRR